MPTVNLNSMVQLFGKWTIDGTGNSCTFRNDDAAEGSHGLALLAATMEDGFLECDIQIPQVSQHSGAFIIFRAAGQKMYYAAGLGGWDSAYTICEGRDLNLSRLTSAGSIDNLVSGRTYKVRINVEGQKMSLSVDGVTVVTHDRIFSLSRTGLGLYAFKGTQQAIFGPLSIQDRRPNAFVAMQFSEPYNDVYRDAIKPLVEQIGYEPFRIDEKAGPGIILNDIWSHITEASVVIAEVSEPNPNVYYEIGVAHALQKPTVLLANRTTKLPFDLGPHRCIFYDNTIPGRAKLVDALRGSLTSLLGLSVNI